MFNNTNPKSTPTEKKVIQIKSHDFFKQNEQVDQVSSKKENIEVLQNKIEALTKQYEKTKNEQLVLIQETKREIEQEKENWIKEKKEWIEQAKEQGFNQGYSEGEAKAQEEYKHIIQQINSIIDRANEDYHAMIAKSDDTIVDLAIHVAEKIIKQRITEEPTRFLSIVKAAIKKLQDQSLITIYLHPENYSFVLDHKQELAQLLEDNMKLSIYVKEELNPNACIIEHPFGQIDASIDTQLAQIRQLLQDIVQENSNE